MDINYLFDASAKQNGSFLKFYFLLVCIFMKT